LGKGKRGAETVTWQIVFTPEAQAMLEAIQDRRIQEKIKERIDHLAQDPIKQGKPLGGDLTDYFSLRAVGQRYRILYRLYDDKILILIVAVGIRKEGSKTDIYALAKKLLRLGLLEPAAKAETGEKPGEPRKAKKEAAEEGEEPPLL
jgi:mRNA interferase RelE/StbE